MQAVRSVSAARSVAGARKSSKTSRSLQHVKMQRSDRPALEQGVFGTGNKELKPLPGEFSSLCDRVHLCGRADRTPSVLGRGRVPPRQPLGDPERCWVPPLSLSAVPVGFQFYPDVGRLRSPNTRGRQLPLEP